MAHALALHIGGWVPGFGRVLAAHKPAKTSIPITHTRARAVYWMSPIGDAPRKTL